MIASFLHQNYPPFYSCIHDLADAATSLSDAATLMSAISSSPWKSGLLVYVGSLTARAVVRHNSQPMPPRFQQISKPRGFSVERLMLERRQQAVAAFHPPTDGVAAVSLALQGWCRTDVMIMMMMVMMMMTIMREDVGYMKGWRGSEFD